MRNASQDKAADMGDTGRRVSELQARCATLEAELAQTTAHLAESAAAKEESDRKWVAEVEGLNARLRDAAEAGKSGQSALASQLQVIGQHNGIFSQLRCYFVDTMEDSLSL